MDSPELKNLLNNAKLRLRITTADFDEEITSLILFVIDDLKRIGVKQQHIKISDTIIFQAIMTYVKANFGESDNYEKLNQSYDSILGKVKGSCKYFEQ